MLAPHPHVLLGGKTRFMKFLILSNVLYWSKMISKSRKNFPSLTEKETLWGREEGDNGWFLAKLGYIEMIILPKIGNRLSVDASGNESGLHFVA